MTETVGEKVKGPHIFFLRDARGFPVACVASKELDDAKLRFAVSICNPKDYRVFDREKAKTIALGRLETPRRLAENVYLTPKETLKERIVRCLTHSTYPRHVQDAAHLWLGDNELRKRERAARALEGTADEHSPAQDN